MNVAESRPASWPSVTSSISTSKPRRSAQRVYIRSIISAQSWASVPPAPAWISPIASRSSCSPVNRLCSSSAETFADSDASVDVSSASRPASTSPLRRDSSTISHSTSPSPSVRSSASKRSKSSETRPSSVVTSRAWSWSSHRSGRAASSPSSARRSRRSEIRRYRSASPSRVRRSARTSAGASSLDRSGPAMAELELLARTAPARLVAADLLLWRLDHCGHRRRRCLRLGLVADHRRVGRRGLGVDLGLVARTRQVVRGRRLRWRGFHVRDVAQVVVVDRVKQALEHRVALTLPRHERVRSAHAAQVDAVSQVVHLREVVAPALVEDREHDIALDLPGHLLASRQLGAVLLVELDTVGPNEFGDLVDRRARGELLDGERRRPVLRDLHDESVQVPLL